VSYKIADMESLLDHITMVQEEELGVKEFQMAVLGALLSLMKEQESLNNTLKTLTEKEKKGKLDEFDNLFTDDSSDEEDKGRGKKPGVIKYVTLCQLLDNDFSIPDTASARPKLYKSGHTQTSQNTQILYYHESKKAALEETLPLLEEKDVDPAIADDEKTAQTQYKWKKRIPATKFGVIIKAKGKLKDQEFQKNIFSCESKFDFELVVIKSLIL
jgi:hypothetical protein